MRRLLLRILKVTLISSMALLCILAVFAVVLILGWPWWVGVFVLLGVLGLLICFVFLRRIWRRRRDERFVDDIIDQDNEYLSSLGDQEQRQARELQEQWKEGVSALKRSYLRRYGDPLYVLPWYLVIGESGSGKTTAIQSARLSTPFAEVKHTSGISGTRNCDWWFFEQAIILDTAGRYAIPLDEGRDKDEWRKFLALLVKYRKKEPLNGLVVTIPANKLVESGPGVLNEYAKSIRRRIDELMRVIGVKFPVYVLVTKLDLIQGMTQLCDNLPESTLGQAMGVVKHDLSADVAAYCRRGLGLIMERLRDLRLILLHQVDSRRVTPGLLLFPEEFESLRPGLEAFVQEAFQKNPYQETPILRGIFFSSGRQEGTPYSHFLGSMGLIHEKEVLPGTSRGFFLHDFFGRILPADRKVFAPTQRAVAWSKFTRNLGLTGWVAILLALCGILSFSFVKNLRTIKEISSKVPSSPVLQGTTLGDMVSMDRFHNAIVTAEKQNRNWWIPRFGLNESKEVEIELKRRFCEQFEGQFLVSFDREMEKRIIRLTELDSGAAFGRHVQHLARRVNLLRARLDGRVLEGLQGMPQPSFELLLDHPAGAENIPEVQKRFQNLYLDYLVWQSQSTKLNSEMTKLQNWLTHALRIKGSNFGWIIAWASADPSLSPVAMKDFWGGALEAQSEADVNGAFTVKGKEKIDTLFNEIESALGDPILVAGQKSEFSAWYRQLYVGVWEDFLEAFPSGKASMEGRDEWHALAMRVVDSEGPYTSLVERMTKEFNPWKTNTDLPSWIQFLYVREIGALGVSQTLGSEEKGFLEKAADKGKRLIDRLERRTGTDGNVELMQYALIPEKVHADYTQYKNALTEIKPAVMSRGQAYEIARQVFMEDPATSDSPFHVAERALRSLEIDLAGDYRSSHFLNVLAEPIRDLWYFVRNEASCQLQDLWEKEVLAEMLTISDPESVNELLLGPEGYAERFVRGSASPFLNRELERGYFPAVALNERIPFEPAFLSFMTKGVKTVRLVGKTYRVSIKGLPTDTNSKAEVKPHGTRFEIHCGNQAITLVNLHYPAKETFDWSPETCGEVTFQILVGETTLTKKYTGYQAFPKFLDDFRDGERTFRPNEFPSAESELERYGIEYITAKYQFEGQGPVLKLLSQPPGEVPRRISKCWVH